MTDRHKAGANTDVKLLKESIVVRGRARARYFTEDGYRIEPTFPEREHETTPTGWDVFDPDGNRVGSSRALRSNPRSTATAQDMLGIDRERRNAAPPPPPEKPVGEVFNDGEYRAERKTEGSESIFIYKDDGFIGSTWGEQNVQRVVDEHRRRLFSRSA